MNSNSIFENQALNLTKHIGMADVLPFKGKGFCGSLEVQGQLTATSKVLRIQRMKEVFEQEKMLAAVAAEAHRQCIADRKAARMRIEKDRKRKEKERELLTLSNKRDDAVCQTGAAHQRAKKNVDIMLKRSEVESKNAARRHEEVIQRGKAALKLRHEQILETQRASMRLLELQQTKREIRMSDREDAHANGEVYSARQQLLALQKEAVANLHSVPVVYTQTRVQQGAVSIEQRFPVEVHAQVWRHGVNGAVNSAVGANNRCLSEVINEAADEEVIVRKKNWSKVMTEMLTKIRVKMRAQVAKNTVQQRKGVIYLESELQRLEAADKAPARLTRVCSTLGVAPDAEPPRVQSTFEKMFLSKPVRLDNKHIQYRTGSHLVQANLEKHVQHVQHQQDVDASGGAFPTWRSELPDHPSGVPSSSVPFAQERFFDRHESYAEADAQSAGGSSEVSEELRVLESDRRMYEDLDGCSTVSDIPTISRPPPQWTSYASYASNSPHGTITTFEQHVQEQGGDDMDAVWRSSQQQQQQRVQTTQQNVAVKIPQVQVRSGGSDSHRQQKVTQKGVRGSPSPLPSSPSSVATSPSTATSSSSSFSQAVSMKSSMDSESSSSSWAAPPPPPPPLSLSIEVVKGSTLDVSVGAAGPTAVTPPRHQSSRGSAGGLRPIDPFTPPEVSAAPRSSHQRPPHQHQPVLHQDRLTGGADSPQSGVSSTNTEQARHDRLPRYDPVPIVPVERRKSTHILLNDSTVSAESYISPPSAPTRGGGVLLASPLWVEEDDDDSLDAAADTSRNDANVSALTDLLFDDGSSTTSTLSELRRAQRAIMSSSDDDADEDGSLQSRSPSNSSERQSGASSKASRLSRERDQSQGSGSSRDGGIRSTSSLASGSSLHSSNNSSSASSSSGSSSSSSSSAGSSASIASSASSSSASMLSYLDSAQKPDRSAVTAALPGVTITLAANNRGVPLRSSPPAQVFSSSQSLDSDSVSLLSNTSDHPHQALHRHEAGNEAERGTLLDSFAALTHQELQDVLDDLSDVEGDTTASPPHARSSSTTYEQHLPHYGHIQQPVPPPGSVDRNLSPSTRSRSRSGREVSPDASDYASMFGSDEEDEDEEDRMDGKKSMQGQSVATGEALRSFPLPHTIDRIEEEEEISVSERGEDLDSVRSASTGELFDRWQQLYQGSVHLGAQARTLRSEHLSAYNASSSVALSEGESFLSQENTSSPPRRATAASSSAVAGVPDSPLNVLVFPHQQQQERMEFSKSTLYESDLRSSHSGSHRSRSSSPTGSDAGSRSSDSLSPRKKPTPRQGHHPVPHSSTITTTYASTTTTRTTSVDVRASYEHNSRATALMSELDKLSLDWQEKQAFYANPLSNKPISAPKTAPPPAAAPAAAPQVPQVLAVGGTPPRVPSSSSRAAVPQPSQPPHYASPSWLSQRSANAEGASSTAGAHVGAGMASTSLSSLSAVNSPPEEATPAIAAAAGDVTATRDVYTGRLLVHGGLRAAYPVTAAHLPDLAARLELEDSMNSSLLSSDIDGQDAPTGLSAVNARGTAYSTYATHSSTYSAYSSEGEDDEEMENRSLEELLNSQAGSATRGRIQSEIAAMRSRLLASVGGSSSSQQQQTVASATGSYTRKEENPSRPVSTPLGNNPPSWIPAATAAEAAAASSTNSRSHHIERNVVTSDAGAAPWSSSGEDTYSSSRYYSAGTKVSTTTSGSGGSSMHTADTSSVDAGTTRHQTHAVDGALRSTGRNTATITSTSTTDVAHSTMHASHYSSSSNFRFVSHTAGGTSSDAAAASTAAAVAAARSPGLRDDSGRPGAYTFTRHGGPAPAASSADPSSPTNSSSAFSSSAAESFLLAQQQEQQQLTSPSTPASVSRLSEYAMLSQHSLHTSRGSPASESHHAQWRPHASGAGAGAGESARERADEIGFGATEDESYEFTRHAGNYNEIRNNTSTASDNSSTFSEYMRHFPSNR